MSRCPPYGFVQSAWTGGALAVVALACGPSGSAPDLAAVDNQVVAVNQELVLVLAATDEDGDELSYSFDTDVPNIEARASINRLPIGAGEFRWTPLAADVGVWYFDFTVSDGHHEDTVRARIDVRAAVGNNSSPQFLHPQGMGTTLNLDQHDCIDLDIEIIDSDSTEVQISQIEPTIDGAELEQVSGLAAVWNWCPTAQQVAADDRYTVLLAADDGENPRTVHPYLIVLRRPIKPDCPGQAPLIAHSASNVNTLVTLSLSADISDDEGLKREPLLYYSETQPSDPPDLAAMTQIAMSLESGTMRSGKWRARVPNPVAGLSAGTSRDLYYLMVANDDDDPDGACDHLTQTEVFSMRITNPGGDGNAPVCDPCTHDVQCGGGPDNCIGLGTSGEAFCAESCTGDVDCPGGFMCSDLVMSVNGMTSRQCVPESVSCKDDVCIDDNREDNDSRSQAQVKPLLPTGSYDLISCPAAVGTGDDEDWFEFTTTGDTTVTVDLLGGDVSDLDLGLYDSSGLTIDSSVSFSSAEQVSACLPAGSYFVRVYAYGQARNSYELDFAKQAGACAATCEADENEDDDNASQARVVSVFPDPHVSTTQSICADDDDWYEIDVFEGETLIVDLTFEQTASGEDLDIHLYDEDGTTDLTPCSPFDASGCDFSNGQSGTSNEHFEWAIPDGCLPCFYYVVVRGYDGSENLYDISIAAEQ